MAEPDDKAPMTIKGVPVETRRKMVAYARNAELHMGEWLTRLVDRHGATAVSDAVIPPDQPDKPAPELLPIPAAAAVSMAEVSALLSALAEIGKAPGRAKPAKDGEELADLHPPAGLSPALLREIEATAKARLREARGLPGLPGKQTRPEKRQTIDGEPVLTTWNGEDIHP